MLASRASKLRSPELLVCCHDGARLVIIVPVRARLTPRSHGWGRDGRVRSVIHARHCLVKRTARA